MSNAEMQTCFCLEELTESKVNLKRLTAALNEQYPIYLSYKGTGSDSEYSAIAALHITATDLWNEFPKILHSLAEYDDEQLYATALKLSDAVKRFDFLKRGNYSALISALSSFADMLPDGKCIDAKAAAHLMNRIKMGYFPTDLEHVKLIKSAVRFPKGQVNILDPCCGEGLALKAFSEGENAVTYGIEIDEEAYEERIQHFIDNGCDSTAVIERWLKKIEALKLKKATYEQVLKRQLDDLDRDFALLQMQSQELSVRAGKNQIKMPLAA